MSLFKDIPIKSFCGYSNFQRDRIVSANSIGPGFAILFFYPNFIMQTV